MSKAFAMALAAGAIYLVFLPLASGQPPTDDRRLTCLDGVKGDSETDVDCGGGTCDACEDGKQCDTGSDCQSRTCDPESALACLLLRNCHGVCKEATCHDKVKNGREGDVDCGGVCGRKCGPGQGCNGRNDCYSGDCTDQQCGPYPIGEDGHNCEDRGRCVIFVTSTRHDGNLGGLLGADAICNARAEAAGLLGDYQAWLCDGDYGPWDRSQRWDVRYVRTDGALIANGWDDLTDGALAHSIDRDEFGNQVSGLVNSLPWSHVRPDGKCDDATYLSPGSGPCPALQRCPLNCAASLYSDGWTSSSPLAQGAKGDVNSTNGFWTDGVTGLCSSPDERIYCIEQ